MNRWGIRSEATAAFAVGAFLLLSGGCQPSNAHNSNKLPPEALQALLEMHPAATDWKQHVPYCDSPTPPPDDAAPEALIAWWSAGNSDGGRPPSDKARQRMLELLLERPALLSSNLNLLPNTPSVHDRVKALCDRERARLDAETPVEREKSRHEYDLSQLQTIQRWLMLNSKYFRDDLLEQVRTSDQAEYSTDVAEDMRTLLKLDPMAGKDVLLSLSRQRRHPVAMIVLLEYSLLPEGKTLASVQPELRDGLMRTVESPKADAGLRYYAMEALAKDRWPGQEQWVEKRFADPTMLKDESGACVYYPIAGLMADCPRWSPLAFRLLNNPDPNVHEASVACLMESLSACGGAISISKQALLALLPWVNDPKWSNNDGRHSFIRALADAGLPECMPAVMALLKNGAGDDLADAAGVAAKYKDAQAIPLLKEALTRLTDDRERKSIVAALYDLGGYSIHQQVQALNGEFEGNLGPTAAPTSQGSEPPTKIQSEGSLLREKLVWDENPVRPALAKAVADLARRGDPLTADYVYDALLKWDYAPGRACLVEMLIGESSLPAIDLYQYGRPESQDALRQAKSTASFLRATLFRAKVFQKDAPAELRRLRDMKGAKGAIGVVLLGDADSARRILNDDDREAALALLAAARIARMRLPTNLVGGLLDGQDTDLADAAEAYLRAEDSAEAHRIVCAHHRGQYLVFGEGMDVDLLLEIQGRPPRLNFDDAPIVLPGADGQPDEIWAMMTGGGRGDVIVRRRGDEAEVTFVPDQRGDVFTRRLSRGELQDMKKLLLECRADELPAFESRVCDGLEATFVHLTNRYGRALYMNNPDTAPFSVYDRLTEYFFKLAGPAMKQTATVPHADDSAASRPAAAP